MEKCDYLFFFGTKINNYYHSLYLLESFPLIISRSPPHLPLSPPNWFNTMAPSGFVSWWWIMSILVWDWERERHHGYGLVVATKMMWVTPPSSLEPFNNYGLLELRQALVVGIESHGMSNRMWMKVSIEASLWVRHIYLKLQYLKYHIKIKYWKYIINFE